MGFFDFLKKKPEPETPAMVLYADAKGTIVPMARSLPPPAARSPRPPTVATLWASWPITAPRC